MKNKTILFLIAVLASLQGLVAAPVTVTFTGISPVTASGYSVGPYSGTIDGKAVELDCVDFANSISVGQSYQANLSSITDGSDLSKTRYGAVANAHALYQQAAWLTLQYHTEAQSEWGDLQATIWNLFVAAAPDPSSNFWLTEAQTNYSGEDYSAFRVVTNVGPVTATGQVQEFLTPHAVPEPGTSVLALAGIAAIALRMRRRA